MSLEDSIRWQNNQMNGWYWQYDVQRTLLSALGYNNDRMFSSANWYKANNAHQRCGKSWPEILQQENDGIFPMIYSIEKEWSGLEWGLDKLSDSGNLHHALSHTMSAFVVVKGESLRGVVGKSQTRIPVTDLRSNIRTFQNYYVNFENPPLEILQSIAGKTRERFGEQWPSRMLFNLDIEYHTQDSRAMDNDIRLFDRLEPARKIVESALLEYGIPHTCIMTGRGYHFVSQVFGSSPFMEELVKMGWKLEYDVSQKADSNDMQDRLGFRIPLTSERAYKAMTRLQQYLFNKVIWKIRTATQTQVEVSDRGSECIVLDNTNQLRSAQTGTVAVVTSPYEKFYAKGGRVLARLNRSHNRREWINIQDAHRKRRYFDSTLQYLQYTVGYIPEASEGLWNLAQDYWRSNLFHKLHQAMDHGQSEHPDTWGHTYRRDNYSYLNPIVGDVFRFGQNRAPTQNLLNPDVLNYFVFELHKHGWQPKHIAGLLRSIYEDGRFGWGDFFYKNAPERHANGWTEIILGQMYEGWNL
jgi:hypothetical protein